MSNYARYVGRVGALAVALGVGSAVAAMPAAVADTTNSGSAGSAHALPASAGSSSSSTTSSTSTPTPPAAARRPAAALTAHPHRFRPIGVGGDRRANRFGLSRRDRGRRVSDRGTFRGKVPEVPEGARSPSRPPHHPKGVVKALTLPTCRGDSLQRPVSEIHLCGHYFGRNRFLRICFVQALHKLGND